MPRVVRKQKSVFDSKAMFWWGGLLFVLLSGFGVSAALGVSDSGAIDINGKIRAVDQSASLSPVNTSVASQLPNGGLRPQSESPNTQTAPQAEVPPVETASTTASTTDEVASTTEETTGIEEPITADTTTQP